MHELLVFTHSVGSIYQQIDAIDWNLMFSIAFEIHII